MLSRIQDTVPGYQAPDIVVSHTSTVELCTDCT
jgi:hypothetical protein